MARERSRTQTEAGLDPALAQKKRARHRLVGAVALCLLAALLIPLILEAEPRQRAREVPLEIASRSKPVVSSAGAMPGLHASGSIGQRVAPVSGQPRFDAPADARVGSNGGDSKTGESTVGGAGAGGSPVAAPAARSTVIELDDQKRGSPAARAAEKAAQDRAARELAGKSRTDKAQTDKVQTDKAAQDRLANEKAGREHAAQARVAQEKAAQDRVARERAAQREAAARNAATADAKRNAGPKPTGDPIASLIGKSEGASSTASSRANSAGGAANAEVAKSAKERARRYLIQIGAYSNIEGARNISNRVMQAGLRPYQETIRTDKGEVIRVRVGPFQDRDAAESAQKSLKAAGVTAAIVAL